jgi:hypothetical protein
LPAPEKKADNIDYLRWVLQQIQLLGIENPSIVLWPACFVNEALVQSIKPCQVVTDIVDDQRLFAANANLVPTITAQYATWLKQSDEVICNSESLIKSLGQEFGRKITHIPNELLVLPPQLKRDPGVQKNNPSRTVIGYVGNMRERMDTESLITTINANKDKDFWFIGQTHTSDFYAKARDLTNCTFWGTLRQVDAERVVTQFDMTLISFLDNALVRSMSPMKKETYKKSKVPTVTLKALDSQSKTPAQSNRKVKTTKP